MISDHTHRSLVRFIPVYCTSTLCKLTTSLTILSILSSCGTRFFDIPLPMSTPCRAASLPLSERTFEVRWSILKTVMRHNVCLEREQISVGSCPLSAQKGDDLDKADRNVDFSATPLFTTPRFHLPFLSPPSALIEGMAEPERKKRGADNQLTQDNWEDDGGDGDDAEV